MQRISLSLISAMASLLLASQIVHATTPTPAPDPDSTSAAEAQAAAEAAARAAAIAAQQQRAEGGNARVEGDTTNYSSRALALSLATMSAAPAVAGQCLVHSRGMGLFGIGVAGGTSLDEACMQDVRRDRFTADCLQIADRYAAAHMLEAFARQLEKCGGVHVDALPAPAPASNPPASATPAPPAAYIPPAGASKEDLAAVEERVNDRMNRIFRQGIGK